MQLDCSWASSWTTSNGITSICDAHHQQCSSLRATANRHLSPLAGHGAPLKPEAATWLSICQFPQQRCGALASTYLNPTLERGGVLPAGAVGRELSSWIASPFWQHGIDAIRVKTEIRLSSGNRYSVRKSSLGQNEEYKNHPSPRILWGLKDIMGRDTYWK